MDRWSEAIIGVQVIHQYYKDAIDQIFAEARDAVDWDSDYSEMRVRIEDFHKHVDKIIEITADIRDRYHEGAVN